jgi:glutamate racemase
MKSQVPTPYCPIGIFDSGVGGLSVLRHIALAMPHEHLLYMADSLYAPYGNKTPEQIQQRAFALSEFLVQQGAKALVIACNTATAAAASALRAHYSLPIIAMEPAVKPAAAVSQTGVIGVLATSGTLQSAQFAALLEHYGKEVRVVTQACIGLVECIERGELQSESTRLLLKKYVQPLLEAGADALVLGCTHYPFVRPLLLEVLKQYPSEQGQQARHISIIDTGDAVARHLQNRLQAAGLLNPSADAGTLQCWSNSPDPHAPAVIRQLMGDSQMQVQTF